VTRVIVVVVALCAIVFAAYWLGGKDARNSNRETQIEREKDISDAIDNCADAHWSVRLRGCE
jgi:flagellar basal body-associated protein FliL|tara:strand:- start:296 stop:481 length:186 start_codon:yes stop_codon:yes gene_type:complete